MTQSFRLENDTLIFDDGTSISLYSDQAFELLSKLWLKTGWNARYHYTFTWMGRPALQLPEDLVRLQEVIVKKKPDVIIETGIAMGGSLLFYASICQTVGHGRVIGIDIDLRPKNRQHLEDHPLITLVDGDSKLVNIPVEKDESVMIILDSNHSKAHVSAELEHLAPLVSVGHYLVVFDGFKGQVSDTPRGKEDWSWDNPVTAVEEFLTQHPEFKLEEPKRSYGNSQVKSVTHITKGWLLKTNQPCP